MCQLRKWEFVQKWAKKNPDIQNLGYYFSSQLNVKMNIKFNFFFQKINFLIPIFFALIF